jgi:hypothetical protein
MSNGSKIDRMSKKYTNPSISRPSKIYPNWDLWSEKKHLAAQLQAFCFLLEPFISDDFPANLFLRGEQQFQTNVCHYDKVATDPFLLHVHVKRVDVSRTGWPECTILMIVFSAGGY